MRERFLERTLLIGIIAIVAITIAGWITLNRIEVLRESAGWVDHTERVRLSLEHILSTLKDGEASARGYIISRDPSFLARYDAVEPELAAELKRVATLTADNPQQTAQAELLGRLIRERMRYLEEGVQLFKEGNQGEINRRMASGEGIRLMTAVGTHIAAMQNTEIALLQRRMSRADEAHRTVLISAATTGLVAVGLVVLLLVVQRRSAAEVLRSEEWLATTLTSIGDGVIATDHTGAIRFVNPVAAQLTGWSQAEARGKPLDSVFRIIQETTRIPVESPVSRVLREGVVVGLANHTLLIRRDGVAFPIEDSGAPIRNAHGGLSGVVLVFKDASEARASARALEESEERLRLILEGAHLGAWDVDLVKGKAVWNDQLYQLTGHPRGTPVTEAMYKLGTTPEDQPLVDEGMEQARRDRTPFQLEHRIVRAHDGAVRWLATRGHFRYDEDGMPVRFMGVTRDVTEARQLAQRVRQAQKLDALGTLAGGIAHDFNNILSILRGNLTVLGSELAAEPGLNPVVTEMNQACDRAAALVRQILTFGSAHEQERQPIQLEDAVAEGLRLLRATLSANIQIHGRYGAQLPHVLADSNQIQQVIANLGTNSAHAIGRRPGVIDVDVEVVQVDEALASSSAELRQGQYVRLRFSDDGAGMPRDVLERVFEPFFTTKAQSSGTGLGLSVVRGIVKNHNAAITVYSEPGQGTSFHLYFPIAAGTATRAGPTATAPRRGRGQRILFLDDEEPLVLLAKRLLDKMGYRVTAFSDSTRALAAFRAGPQDFDLVLTDLSMPGASGIDVAKEILAIRSDIPVLLATGYVRPEDVELARSVGIREVMWKPQTVAEMGEVLGQLLDRIVPAA
ncbi:MAG TPA: CHASE3 domain-containing protein [Steroidobacteraceae bacterium]|nr:CHASE3 domain-containing protein [Steroidobacteraceae bacterium]